MTRLLLLEDNLNDAELIVAMLTHRGLAFEWKRVATKEEFAVSFDLEWDVIVADYALTQFDALEVLRLMKKWEIKTPVIIFTGAIPESRRQEVEQTCRRAGAVAFLFKSDVYRLYDAVLKAVGHGGDSGSD